MNKVLAVVCLFPVFACGGEKGGVAEPNFEVGGGYSDDDSAREVSASGAYRFGIDEYFGIGLAANAEHSDGKSYYLDSNGASAGINVFARRFDLGKVGLSYTRLYNKYDSSFDDFSTSSDHFSASAAYYFNDVTVGASRLAMRSDDLPDFDSASLFASVYLLDNTKLTAVVGGMDAKDSFGLSAEYQPSVFDDSTSVSLSYSRSPDHDSISFGLNYFFNSNVPLKQRDRQYR